MYPSDVFCSPLCLYSVFTLIVLRKWLLDAFLNVAVGISKQTKLWYGSIIFLAVCIIITYFLTDSTVRNYLGFLQ